METIDITKCRKRGQNLHDEIERRVTEAQGHSENQLPSFLRVTKAQFIHIGKHRGGIPKDFEPRRLEPWHFKGELYPTDQNIMEMKVVGYEQS